MKKTKTYQADLALFEKLNLSPFEIDCRQKTFVGEYHFEESDASVKIWVISHCPSLFWDFEIKTSDNRKVKLETGSGALINYWNFVATVAHDLLVFVNEKPFN